MITQLTQNRSTRRTHSILNSTINRLQRTDSFLKDRGQDSQGHNPQTQTSYEAKRHEKTSYILRALRERHTQALACGHNLDLTESATRLHEKICPKRSDTMGCEMGFLRPIFFGGSCVIPWSSGKGGRGRNWGAWNGDEFAAKLGNWVPEMVRCAQASWC